jgi:predicted DNA binding CopG/RHH family protein
MTLLAKRNKIQNKPHRINLRAREEDMELVHKIMIDLGLNKTEAIEHIFETYRMALKVISNK